MKTLEKPMMKKPAWVRTRWRGVFEESSLIGPEAYVRDRLQEYQESGVNALNISLLGSTRAERVATLDKLRNLVATL